MSPGEPLMQAMLEFVAKGLVDKPDEVRVVKTERDGAILFQLHVAPEDVGKVIGRQGRVVRALRTLVRAAGGRVNQRALLEVVDE